MNSRRYDLYIFLFSLIIRIITVLIFLNARGLFLQIDSKEYVQYAHEILRQGWMVNDISKLNGSLIGPGYPFLVAFNYYISGHDNYSLLIIIQAIAGSLIPVIIYKIACLFMKQKYAFLAGLWMSVYFLQIWYTAWVLKEVLVFFLFPLCVYLIIKVRQNPKAFTKEVLFFIISFGYLIHSDERYLIFFPLFLFFILFPYNSWKQRIPVVLTVSAGLLLFMGPWLYRNYIVYHRPVIITERTAKYTDKLLGFEDRNLFLQKLSAGKSSRIMPSFQNCAFYESIIDSLESGQQIKSNEKQVYGINSLKEEYIKGNIPVRFNSYQERLSYFTEYWRPLKFRSSFWGSGFRVMPAWTKKMNFVSIVQYGILLPFFILGLFLAFRKGNPELVFVISVICLHSFTHIFLFWGIQRYRIPIDGFIILISFWAIQEISTRIASWPQSNHS